MPTIRPAPTNRSSNAASNIGVGARLERDLHPGAWWIWSLGMATAASRTTNPLLLAVIVAVVAVVVSVRRGDAPWSKGFTAYLVLGLIIIGLRIVFRMLLDGEGGQHVLFRLPELPLPEVARGIRIGGAVSLEGILAALYDGSKNLVGTTGDQSTAWTSVGTKTMALTGGPYAISANSFYYVAYFANGTTRPSFGRLGSNLGGMNGLLSSANSRFASSSTGRTTSMPATLGAFTATNVAYWVAVS